jgi:mannose-1-phosphate guanylyltransferase
MAANEKSAKRIMPVILSGGAGTRLWPMSTESRPKQFLALVGDCTMFQMTLQRTACAEVFLPPLIVGSAAHAALMQQQMAEIGIVPEAIILEPVARNTAPAVALAALAAGAADTPILVMPSDHVIGDVTAFLEAVATALPAAEQGWLVTFGIRPNGPETGYGYIALSNACIADSQVYQASGFIEKPDRAWAVELVEGGNHVWNSGIFLFRADAYLKALKLSAPDMVIDVFASFENAVRDGQIIAPSRTSFENIVSDSIDYAVMEKADNVAVVPVSCGWSDIGSWDALADIGSVDAQGCQHAGNIIAIESENNLVRADGIRVSLCGVNDLVVIANEEEVMIVRRGHSQQVKRIVEATRLASTA